MTTSKMEIDPPLTPAEETVPHQLQPKPKTKTRDLATLTIKSPAFTYAHLSSSIPFSTTSQQETNLDALQVKSYLTAALRQFLGDTGVAIPIDILLVKGTSAWVRLPQPDLGAFAGAITAFPGLGGGGETLLLHLEACGDYLGSLIGRAEEADMWRS
ncbi:hypothetical protein QBC35DRAFT_164511 [Podospora australis]|uniref:Ribonucleases P/MRP subunit Pop8-like domain-containing protein n=1 Tax=Podospora australis TaxID=1536484 RepID=A0AAN6X4F4_9PEZI|nr:hypothetical protein QBC35DRAFT_164511 [Podospora australis]